MNFNRNLSSCFRNLNWFLRQLNRQYLQREKISSSVREIKEEKGKRKGRRRGKKKKEEKGEKGEKRNFSKIQLSRTSQRHERSTNSESTFHNFNSKNKRFSLVENRKLSQITRENSFLFCNLFPVLFLFNQTMRKRKEKKVSGKLPF